MAWVGEDLWMVNTLFSCLCTLHGATASSRGGGLLSSRQSRRTAVT